MYVCYHVWQFGKLTIYSSKKILRQFRVELDPWYQSLSKVEHIFCASWRPLESNKNGTMHAHCSQEGPSLAVARFSVDDVDGGRKKSCTTRNL